MHETKGGKGHNVFWLFPSKESKKEYKIDTIWSDVRHNRTSHLCLAVRENNGRRFVSVVHLMS